MRAWEWDEEERGRRSGACAERLRAPETDSIAQAPEGNGTLTFRRGPPGWGWGTDNSVSMRRCFLLGEKEWIPVTCSFPWRRGWPAGPASCPALCRVPQLP